ncbi:MAG TPA: 4Fe-4S dicluster domain-containing protein, partial [Candidatus Bathyarchaeota archaeon]|nr:4Fe-4S dicluster domain-containing protein [Candidatus Bathyarchaeota archaeon]
MSGLKEIKVIKEKCTGCGACVQACPFGAIE